MNVLIACEESAVVREAFRKRGHNAWSCDLLPTRVPGYHFTADLFDVLPWHGVKPWDMVIAFPPCTHLASSGAKHFAKKRADGRQKQGIDFFMRIVDTCKGLNIPFAIENPVGIMSTEYRKPDQIIQPWQFGHEATKTTCLWLHGLPLLTPTRIVGKGSRHVTKGGKSLPAWYNLPPSPDRAKIRSATFQGIADAMADQWG